MIMLGEAIQHLKGESSLETIYFVLFDAAAFAEFQKNLGTVEERALFRGGRRLSSSETPLAAILAERIRRFGPITFAEYMREALYHPLHGYYTQTRGTCVSPITTPVSMCIRFSDGCWRGSFAEMWERMDRPARFTMVEAGAGSGRLAEHILEFARAALPEFYAALHYMAVERSPARSDQLSSAT